MAVAQKSPKVRPWPSCRSTSATPPSSFQVRSQRAALTAPADFAGPAKLKPRGFTSLRFYPKKSYSMETLDGAGVQRYDWYPMIRGRLVSVNGKPVTPETFGGERAKRLVEREFNLSHTAQLPGHNRVTAGQWVNDEAGAASVEDGLAQELGLKLGDRIGFDVGGTPHEARITSLRKVDWGSMRVNFFVIFPLAQMPGLPATVITAFRAPEVAGFDNALSRDFPNITMVDVSAQIDQVQRVLGQVIRAVELLFAFTLAAGTPA